MSYIIETDLGHDPDDLFCICHLAEMGLPIKAIGVVPGGKEQLDLACGLREHLGLNCEIGRSKIDTKPEHLGIHDDLCKMYGWNKGKADGTNAEVFARALNEEPEADLLVIGPAPGLWKVANLCRGRLAFQGGFLPYSMFRPKLPVPKMDKEESVPTFNFNGCREAVLALLEAPLQIRRFCGKNVCHSIILDKEKVGKMAPARNKAGGLYLEAAKIYFDRHNEKKMHDPTALVCHLHPEIATWFRGKPAKKGSGWTTHPDPDGDYILADVDQNQLWKHILERT